MTTKYKILTVIIIPVLFIGAAAAWFLEAPFVSDNARLSALSALQEGLGSAPEKGTLIIVDFSQPSQTRRLGVWCLETRNMLFYARVAHGRNSGVIYASKLSNTINSRQSSAGLFAVTESFKGKRGASLRLKGLAPHRNGNAELRGIIIHSAAYVSLRAILANWKERFRLGRSDGCFALSSVDFRRLKDTLVRPAYLYAHPYGAQPP